MLKKTCALLLLLATVICFCSPAFAEENESDFIVNWWIGCADDPSGENAISYLDSYFDISVSYETGIDIKPRVSIEEAALE